MKVAGLVSNRGTTTANATAIAMVIAKENTAANMTVNPIAIAMLNAMMSQ